MFAILHSLGMFVADLFKPRCRLEAENLFLRHQLSIALRRAPPRLRLRGGDRALLVWMTRLWPSLLGAAKVVQPETILRWHRSGFKAFWRWKSRKRAGRPKIDRGLRDLIQRMSKENQQWGASRIHGELLMLGFEVAESTVSKYMMRHRGPPSQTWRTFLRNHAEAIAAIDLCVVPTVIFELLFAFVVVGHGRRQLLWFAVTQNPSAEWQYYNEARTHLSLHKDARIPRAVRAVLEMLAVDDTRRGWFHSREERLQHALSSSLLAAHIDS